RPGPGGRGCQAARRERAEHLRLAQAIRGVWRGRSAQAQGGRVRERTATQAAGRAGPGDRGDEGDQSPKVVSVQVRQEQARVACSLGVSQRRACTLYGVSRSGLRYEPTKAHKDAPVVTRMKALSAQYPRYGYRRISIFLAREGHAMSMSRA